MYVENIKRKSYAMQKSHTLQKYFSLLLNTQEQRVEEGEKLQRMSSAYRFVNTTK